MKESNGSLAVSAWRASLNGLGCLSQAKSSYNAPFPSAKPGSLVTDPCCDKEDSFVTGVVKGEGERDIRRNNHWRKEK